MQSKFNRRQMLKTAGLSLAALGLPKISGAKTSSGEGKARTVFITGGARGIGFQTALEFAEGGDNIVLYDIARQIESVSYPLASTKDLENARRKIESLGVRCLAIQGDVRSSVELEAAVDKTLEVMGSIDILVANAAFSAWGDVGEIPDQTIDDMLAVNIAGVIRTVQAVTPWFKKQKSGRIVCMSSIAGRAGAWKFSLYSATKWAVIGFVKSVALELGQYHVTCNAICPTSVNTPLLNNAYMGSIFGNPDQPLKAAGEYFRTIHALPEGVIEPVEISRAIRFLCSPEAEKITGSVIDVDAGVIAGNNA